MKDDEDRLVAVAWEVRGRARAPWSRFPVGAVLLDGEGKVWTGCNVESASYPLTCCAERVAVYKALSEGAGGFVAVVVVAEAPEPAMPCGGCRQVLYEYARDAVVIADNGRERRRATVRELLPAGFDGSSLPGRGP